MEKRERNSVASCSSSSSRDCQAYGLHALQISALINLRRCLDDLGLDEKDARKKEEQEDDDDDDDGAGGTRALIVVLAHAHARRLCRRTHDMGEKYSQITPVFP